MFGFAKQTELDALREKVNHLARQIEAMAKGEPIETIEQIKLNEPEKLYAKTFEKVVKMMPKETEKKGYNKYLWKQPKGYDVWVLETGDMSYGMTIWSDIEKADGSTYRFCCNYRIRPDDDKNTIVFRTLKDYKKYRSYSPAEKERYQELKKKVMEVVDCEGNSKWSDVFRNKRPDDSGDTARR